MRSLNKKIVLIQPRTGSWDMMSLRFPEALLAIAALPQQKGYEVTILDQRLDHNWKSTLISLLAQNPVLVGTTSMTGEQIGYMVDILKFIKSHCSVPTVLGGVHASLIPKQTIASSFIDIVCEGEGDFTLCDIADNLYEKKDLDNIRGIYFKRNGEIIYTGPRDVIKDLDVLPMPPYELLAMDKYSTFEIGEGKTATIFTSRGCPYRCKFCASPVVNRIWRGFSVDRVIANIQLLQDQYQVSNIYFQDDNLAGSLTRFKELVRRLKKKDKKIKWGTLGIRADAICRLDQEDLDCLFESGCHDLDIGVETGSSRVNTFIRKDESLETIAEANKRLAAYPIKIKYTFIVGFPTETEQEVNESIDFALQLTTVNKNAYALFFVFAPIVGTEFYDFALQHGFKEPDSLEEWRYLQFDGWLEKYPNWLNKKEIKRLQALSFVSYFASQNVRYKFTNFYMKLIFMVYHPIASFRFRRKFFGLFIEGYLQKVIFWIKEKVGTLFALRF